MECGFDRWLDAKMGALMERDRRSVLTLDEAVKSVAGRPYLALMLFGGISPGCSSSHFHDGSLTIWPKMTARAAARGRLAHQ